MRSFSLGRLLSSDVNDSRLDFVQCLEGKIMANVFRGIAHTLETVTSECAEFNRAWRNSGDPQEFPRFWEGQWRSETNGHHGSLRCVLTVIKNGRIEAFFRAKYSRFLRACYRVELAASETADKIRVSGSADLGSLAGGVYRYEGTIAGDQFVCRYDCSYDNGQFILRSIKKPRSS